MSCPRCGDDCRCSSAKERDGRTSVLIDPDAYDPSEQQFAATLESSGTVARSVNVLGARPAPPAAPLPPALTTSDSTAVDDSWRDEVAKWEKDPNYGMRVWPSAWGLPIHYQPIR